MRKKITEIMGQIALGLIFLIMLSACATQPPQRIQSAIQTMNRYMPEYVTEANKALENVEHPKRERLIGNGERLADALTTLNKWASESSEASESEDKGK